MWGKWLRLGLGVSLSLVAFGLAANQVEWARLAAAIGRVQWAWLSLALGSLALTMGAKVVRWRILLGDGHELKLSTLTRALLIGYLLNTVLPGRTGELARAGIIARKGRLELGHALSSIVVEKIFDILTLLLLAATFSGTVALPGWLARVSQVSGLVVLCAVVLLLLASKAGRRIYPAIQRSIAGRSDLAARALSAAYEHGIGPFLKGVSVLDDRRTVNRVAVWSAIVWTTGLAVNFFVLKAFDISPALPAAGLTLVATNLGMAVPSAPGYLGVYHYLTLLALQPFLVERELALGYAVVAHLVIFGSFVVAGALASWWELGMAPGRSASVETKA